MLQESCLCVLSPVKSGESVARRARMVAWRCHFEGNPAPPCVIPAPPCVIPAQAGIQINGILPTIGMDSGFRRNDE